jgi:ribonuclease HII
MAFAMSPIPGTDSLSLFDSAPGAPDFALEDFLLSKDGRHVAGVDEAGRGPLAGPVVAAAVILDPSSLPDGLNDSKLLSEERRTVLFNDILTQAVSVSWMAVGPSRIDRINILQASLEAMAGAVACLRIRPGHALFDGRDIPLPCREYGQALIKGDGRSLSIAAASIVAKVVRDRIMIQACGHYPVYGFSSHKGYGSARHRAAIAEHGPCALHRMSFAPLRET